MRCAAMFGLAVTGAILLGCAPRTPATMALSSPETSCRFWSDKVAATSFDSLTAMPEPVWRGIAKLLAPDAKPESLPTDLPKIIAPRDGKWQATDVVIEGEDLPRHRFIRGVETKTKFQMNWYVWLENGGFVHNTALAIFTANPDIKLVASFITIGENSCTIAKLYESDPFIIQTDR